MQKDKKIGFFQKTFLAMTDFRVYPYILKTEKLAKSFSYFICFILLLVAIISIRYSSDITSIVGDFIDEYETAIPEFTLIDGKLDVEKKDVVKINNDLVAIIDTEYNYAEYTSTEVYRKTSRYDSRIFINQDAITYENFDGSGIQLLLKDVEKDYDKATFYEYISSIMNSTKGKIVIVLTVFITVFMAYGLLKFLEILLYAIFASVVAMFYGIKVEFKNYLKIAIYIVTLPYIIELLSIVYTGVLKDYALMISSIIAYVYIFYAVRAIKLDAFLLIMNNKNVMVKKASDKENIVSILNDNEEKKDENEKQNDGESKENQNDNSNEND